MKATSHFVGVSLDNSRFADLFISLQTYFKDHALEDAVEFQNILSLHITLYYLDAKLDDNDERQILEDISRISSDNKLSVVKLNGAYFGEPGKERLCYLSCNQNTSFESINQFFAEKYNYSQIPENQLKFVPHISLFRINDPVTYAPHKTAVNGLITDALTEIDCNDLVQGLYLFQVSSLFHPEIQIPM